MTLSNVIRAIRELASVLGGGSVYLMTSLAIGGVMGLIAEFIDKNPYRWGFCGLFLPLPILYFYFSSERAIRSRLRYYKSLQDEKLITPQQFSQLRRSLLRWYMLRQFGQAGLELPLDDEPSTPSNPQSPS